MDKKQGVFKAGTVFVKSKRYYSEDNRYAMVCQHDENLVVYKFAANESYKAIWNSKTNGKAVEKCVFQTDANLVLYDYTVTPVWDAYTDTARRAEAKKSWSERIFPQPDKLSPTDVQKWMTMQNDGNLVIYSGT